MINTSLSLSAASFRGWAARLSVLVLFLLFQTFPVRYSEAAAVQGRCVGVSDGDTVTLLIGRKEEKVRLFGIDAPEKAQPFGLRAKQYASALVFGRMVTLERTDTDRYGRTVGKVFVNDRSLNEEMLRAGLAWHYAAYAHDPGFAMLERRARLERRGLWADPIPVPPWEFRRIKRNSQTAVSLLKSWR